MKKLFRLLITIGIFILIGTAGANDINKLLFHEIVKQCLISFSFITIGLLGLNCRLLIKRQQVKNRHKYNRKYNVSYAVQS